MTQFERVEHDPDALEFMRLKVPGSHKKSSDDDKYKADCPACGATNLFYWSDKMPHNGGCYKCKYTVKSVFELGYRTKHTSTKPRKDMTTLDGLRTYFYNKGGKKHRLCDDVVREFELASFSLNKKNGLGSYHNICIPEENEVGCIKHLNYDGRWISIQRRFRTNKAWLNIERIKPSDKTIYVLAGEWDMFAFWKFTGIHGISPVDGEGGSGKFKKEHYEIFSSREVVILYDNDKTGRAGSKDLAKNIRKHFKVKSIKLPDLTRLGLLGGGDVDDFFASGGTKERLFDEIDSTPDYSSSLSDEEIEIKRIDKPFDRPENIHSVLEPDVQDMVWKTLLLPESKRDQIFIKIAESEGFSRNIDAGLFKAQVKIYIQELNTLRYISYDSLIKAWFEKYHIKQAKMYSEMSEQLYYCYKDGYYQFFNEEFYMSSGDAIAKQITSPDSRIELSRTRKQAAEDIKVKLFDSVETEFDKFKEYINFENGTYQLSNHTLVPHSPDYLMNYKLPITYDPSKDCPNFREALNDWMHNDEDKRELLKALYYLISGDRSRSIVIWLQGDGNDGKGEFVQLCKSLIGDKRTSSLAIETIEKTHYTAELYNKSLNIADEIPKNFIIPDAMFKRISGNSVITGDPKYKGLISFVSKALWIIPSNHYPNTSDTSHGYFRRFKIFPFKRIPKNKEIGHFFETKLKHELPGIINLILTEGRSYYEMEGFIKTKSEERSTKDMQAKNSAFSYWQTVFSTYEQIVDDKVKELEASADYSSFPEGQVKLDAIAHLTNKPYNIDEIDGDDVMQFYDHKELKKIRIIHVTKHYEFYRLHFKNDEVKLMSLSNFRQSTINFYKEYYGETYVLDTIRIWSKVLGSEKKNLTFILLKTPVELEPF